MQNELVIVRDNLGKPRLARVSEDRGEIVTIVAAEVQAAALGSECPTVPIGFRRCDVFRYTQELMSSGNWTKGVPL